MTVEQRGFLYKTSSNFGIETKMWKVKIEKCSPSLLVLPLKEDFFAFGHWFCSRYCLAHRRNQQGAGDGIWKPWLLPPPSLIRHFMALFFPLLSYSWTAIVVLLHLVQTEDTSFFPWNGISSLCLLLREENLRKRGKRVLPPEELAKRCSTSPLLEEEKRQFGPASGRAVLHISDNSLLLFYLCSEV